MNDMDTWQGNEMKLWWAYLVLYINPVFLCTFAICLISPSFKALVILFLRSLWTCLVKMTTRIIPSWLSSVYSFLTKTHTEPHNDNTGITLPGAWPSPVIAASDNDIQLLDSVPSELQLAKQRAAELEQSLDKEREVSKSKDASRDDEISTLEGKVRDLKNQLADALEYSTKPRYENFSWPQGLYDHVALIRPNASAKKIQELQDKLEKTQTTIQSLKGRLERGETFDNRTNWLAKIDEKDEIIKQLDDKVQQLEKDAREPSSAIVKISEEVQKTEELNQKVAQLEQDNAQLVQKMSKKDEEIALLKEQLQITSQQVVLSQQPVEPQAPIPSNVTGSSELAGAEQKIRELQCALNQQATQLQGRYDQDSYAADMEAAYQLGKSQFIQAAEKEHQRIIDANNAAHQTQMRVLRQQHDAALTAQGTEYAAAISHAKSSVRSYSSKKLCETKKLLLKARRSAARQQHQSQELLSDINEHLSGHSEEVETLHEMYQQQIAELTADFNDQLMDQYEQVEQLTKDNAELAEQLDAAQDKFLERDTKVDTLEDQLGSVMGNLSLGCADEKADDSDDERRGTSDVKGKGKAKQQSPEPEFEFNIPDAPVSLKPNIFRRRPHKS
ncbi:hypothetical protein UCRPC4_g01228 [Phaeomoniella chlamydospora]|uniref:Uncharacterized protein n=1 Tax=Phaeomoniella chlamydospora TaxID=158046 RepID=A0A0G2EYM2_PHACM|nr:hypothetical protein UCRPC4_g01228 [Phaeomoniella chlamydospora]